MASLHQLNEKYSYLSVVQGETRKPLAYNPKSTAPWTLQVRKVFVFPEKFQEIQALVEWLKGYDPSSRIVTFQSVELTPLFLRAVPDPLVMESWGDEAEYFPLGRGITELQAREVVRELLLAIYDLHHRGIAHGHIHLDDLRRHHPTGRVVILGHIFPITAFIPNTFYARHKLLCAAPEIVKREPFGYSSDIWSVGVVLHQLLIPERIFVTEDIISTDLLSPFLIGLDELTQSFLILCLKAEPSERPTLAELLLHPFVRNTMRTPSAVDAEEGSPDHAECCGDRNSSSSHSENNDEFSQSVEEGCDSEQSEYDSETSEDSSEIKYVRL